MSIERVRPYLEEKGMADRIIEFDVSSATVELAAAALGCEGKRIAKTLSFMPAASSFFLVELYASNIVIFQILRLASL